MRRIPRFKSHLRVKVTPPDLVLFLGESGYRIVHARILFLLAPLINGVNTVPDIVRRLKGQATAFDIESGILLLEAEGLLLDANDAPPSGLDVFRDLLNIDPKLFWRTSKTKRTRVLSFGEISTASLFTALKNVGIQPTTNAAFTIVLVDDYLREELNDFNGEAIRRKQDWMIVKPTGTVLWLGPVFHPPETACWACLASRVRQNRQPEAFGGNENFLSETLPVVPSIVDVALNLAAIETLKYLTLNSSSQEPLTLITLDVINMKVDKHAVTRLDDCPACGRPAKKSKSSPRPLILKNCRKIFTQDGGHRSASAESTYQKYSHHISTITGIVDQVEAYRTDSNGLIHSFVAGHLFVPRTENLLRSGLKQMSAGKGMTPQQAKTGALCEALERYSGVFRGDEIRITATFRELRDQAIHPNTCMNFSETQYKNRESSNNSRSSHDWVPMPFDERRKIEWTPVWSLTRNSFRYVPTAYCYYGYRLPADHDFCRADSNGNAAGNTLEEAILHGFLELAERDSAAVWWFNRAQRPAVHLESFALPYFEALRDYYRTLGRDLWALDITADFRIPCFAALSAPRRSGRREFLLGLGSHFDPVVALARALTEMNQFLPALLSGHSKRVLKPASSRLDFLTPDPALPSKTLEDFPRCVSKDLRDDVMTCVELAQERRMETLVLDQTRTDVGLPVVKVIVPGLRQFWARFGKGRLYDIPVQLGCLKKQLREDELNPDRIAI